MRGCGEPLARRDRSMVCPRGHSFDVARSGYVSLLQPQDRRSKQPGDPRQAVAARRRFLEAGHGAPLLKALLAEIDAIGLLPGAAILDVGCGEGTYLGGVARERRVEPHGLDLSTFAVDLAARQFPGITWIVANADRFLPYADGSFALILSIDARLHAAEMRRVLAPEGRLLVAVPAPDDLVELRQAVLGEGILKDRLQSAAARLAACFELETRRTVRDRLRLGPAEARDALAATYRGVRESQRQRTAEVREMEVTLSHELARFRPRETADATGEVYPTR